MVKVYALRAFSQGMELSLEGIKRALELGADGIVMELFTTKDGIPVVSLTEDLGGRRMPDLDYAAVARTGALDLRSLLKGVESEVLLWVRDTKALDLAPRAILELRVKERCYLVVENVLQVRAVRNVDSGVKVVTLVKNPFPNVQLIAREGANSIAIPVTLVKPRLVRECASRGLKLFAWSVNDISLAVRALKYGVEHLVTSRPSLKKEVERFTRY